MKLPHDIPRVVTAALAEDVGSGDITATLIPGSQTAHASIITRQPAVVAGIPWFNEVFHQLDNTVRINWRVADGDRIQTNDVLCELDGRTRSLLTGERTALNFLQTLSATATLTRHFVDAVSGTQAKILDTRKTIPGLRSAQKYAALCSGVTNHRMGLFDAILIKENHIYAAGSIETAVNQAKKEHPDVLLEVEVETLEQLKIAIQQPVDRILLDNMDLPTLEKAVAVNAAKIPLEASGGVNLANVREIALTGVDYISIGEITKNIQAIDFSMRIKNIPR